MKSNLTPTVIQLELTPEVMGNRHITRDNAKNIDSIYSITPDNIVVREGFNVRTCWGDIESLAASILANGQEQPGKVDILADGRFVISEGERRLRAILLLHSQGHTEILFKATQNKVIITETQRLFQMFTTQDNKQLEPHEVAELIKRLVDLGVKQTDIAKQIGKTDAYVSGLLSFAKESPEVKQLVAEGKTSVSAVLTVKKKVKDPEARKAMITGAVNKELNEHDEDVRITDEEDDFEENRDIYRPNQEGYKEPVDNSDSSDIPVHQDNTKTSAKTQLQESPVSAQQILGIDTKEQKAEKIAQAIMNSVMATDFREMTLESLTDLIKSYL